MLIYHIQQVSNIANIGLGIAIKLVFARPFKDGAYRLEYKRPLRKGSVELSFSYNTKMAALNDEDAQHR